MLSVIIICLNEERYIGNTLACLARQTYPDFEVIIIDGHSPDKTKEVGLSYRKRFKRFSFCKARRRGIPQQRNEGARKAKGDYFYFLDADVSMDEEFLERTSREMEKRQLEIASVYVQSSGRNPIDAAYYCILDAWFWVMQFIYPHCVGSCIVSTKKVHESIRGFDETILLAEDNDYVNRAHKQFHYRMLHACIRVSSRRFEKEGRIRMGITYLLIFFHRVFKGEIRTDRFRYRFGHYESK